MGQGDFLYMPGATGGGSTSQLGPDSNPTTPTTGINLTSQLFANRPIPIWKDPASQIWPVQEALWPLSYQIIHPSTSTNAPSTLGPGTAPADTSTISHATPANTSRYSRSPTIIYTAAAAAINRGAGFIPSSATQNALFYRGDAANLGGFFYFCRWGMQVYAAGSRAFVGLTRATSNATFWDGSVEPSGSAGDYIGLGMDAADATCTLFTRDNATTTKTAIPSMPAAATAGAFFIDFYMYAKPNDSLIYYRVDNLVTGTTLVDTSIGTTLPRNTIFMAPIAVMGTGTQAATQTAIGVKKSYCIGQQN